MALAGNAAVGFHSACIIRVAKLDADCSPTGGACGGFVSAAIITMTADPDIREGTVVEAVTGCGDTLFKVNKPDKLLGYNLSGDLGMWDAEQMAILFGGQALLGEGGGDYAGETIGYADPLYTNPAGNGVYLEIITQAAAEGAGDCLASASTPVAYGHIFGKVKMVPGSKSYQEDLIVMSFTGKGVNNPSLADGPWNDSPVQGYLPNAPFFYVGYSEAQYDAILAEVAAGCATLPAGS